MAAFGSGAYSCVAVRAKREAIVTALEEFNQRRRMAELVKHAGTFADNFPTNDEIESVDASGVNRAS